MLGWHENLQQSELPGKDIWTNNKALEAHFAKIRDKWRNKAGEAPEGTLSDARAGKEVTLSNVLVDQLRYSQSGERDDYMEI